MAEKEDTQGNSNLGCCSSFMSRFFGAGSEEGKAEKFGFKNCEQMVKQFCTDKDGKLNFETCRARMTKLFKETEQAACCKGSNS